MCQWSPSHRHVIISSSGRFFLASSRGENCWKTKEKILTFIFENKHLALRVVFENAAPAFFFPLCPYKAPISPALWLPLECHVFIYKRETAANALVRCCFHAYADSTYAHHLEEEEQQNKPGKGRQTNGGAVVESDMTLNSIEKVETWKLYQQQQQQQQQQNGGQPKVVTVEETTREGSTSSHGIQRGDRRTEDVGERCSGWLIFLFSR